MAIMSLRQYARHRGMTISAVQKAIKTERIARLADGQINSDEADAAWERNTKAYAPAVTQGLEPVEEEGSGFGARQYITARAIREHYQARLAKLKYEEAVGKLVSNDEVQVAAFNRFRQLRVHMLKVPDALAAMLAAEADTVKCYEILATEIRKALDDFADTNG
jgi:hypothetical protein